MYFRFVKDMSEPHLIVLQQRADASLDLVGAKQPSNFGPVFSIDSYSSSWQNHIRPPCSRTVFCSETAACSEEAFQCYSNLFHTPQNA
jgi:hypothetical protein